MIPVSVVMTAACASAEAGPETQLRSALVLYVQSVDSDEGQLDRLIATSVERPPSPLPVATEVERAVAAAIRQGFADLVEERQEGAREVLELIRGHARGRAALRPTG